VGELIVHLIPDNLSDIIKTAQQKADITMEAQANEAGIGGR